MSAPPKTIETDDDGRPKLDPRQVRLKKELKDELLADIDKKLDFLREYVECAKCAPGYAAAEAELKFRRSMIAKKSGD